MNPDEDVLLKIHDFSQGPIIPIFANPFRELQLTFEHTQIFFSKSTEASIPEK